MEQAKPERMSRAEIQAAAAAKQKQIVEKFAPKKSSHSSLTSPVYQGAIPLIPTPSPPRMQYMPPTVEDYQDDTDQDGLFVPPSPHYDAPSPSIEGNVKAGRKRKASKDSQAPKFSESQRPSRAALIKKPRSKASRKSESSNYTNRADESVISRILQNDVFQDTAATAHLGSQPEFGNQTKRTDMWKDMLAKLPEKDQKDAKQDQRILDEAVAYINGNENATGRRTAHMVGGTQSWNLKGIKTPLKSYQIMGVSFMRKREHSQVEPRGGLLCDGMGLGKTLQCLANIVNGRPPANSEAKATLVVASPALVKQWRTEIDLHCYTRKEHEWGVGDVVEYHAGSRPNHSNLKEMLGNASIVLTTYHEVARSYPKASIPYDLVTPQQKDDWWRDHFERYRGVLHDINWYRVCLDEAAYIKNHACHTSLACQALNYQHAWAITGTPIMNNLSEFYALFKFVRCPNTITYKIFKENFEDNCMDMEGVQKLCYFLEEYMIRRTHADTLFNARILDLPPPEEKTLWISFTPLERQIYSIVQDRMIQKINAVVAHEGVQADKSNSHVWTLLLRLRQMCSHVLLISDTVVDVLERSDFERLNDLCDRSEDLGQEGQALLRSLREVLAENIQEKVEDDLDNDSDADPDTVQKARESEHMAQISVCVKCSKTAEDAVVTSCYHLYCFSCLEELQHRAARMGSDSARCVACNTYYESAKRIDTESIDMVPAGQTTKNPTYKVQTRNSNRKRKFRHEVLCSAKTRAARTQIRHWFEESPDCKIIVYTQFLEIVTIMSEVCAAEGWGHVRYVGTMSHASRGKAIERFGAEPETQVMLASLKCGGIGLNLTMASRVLNLDPWYNLAVENQAFCRVFRIGQTHATQMTRVVVRDSIDSAMHALKERKQVEIDAVMDARGPDKFSVRELMELLGKVKQDGKGKPYIDRGGLAKSVLRRGDK